MSFYQRRPKGAKYGNRKYTTQDGITFDSLRECRRYEELKLMERAGEISDLQRQVDFELIPSQKGPDGKVMERPVKYVADFTYKTKAGEVVVEDTKGFRTPDYIIKRKLMLYLWGISIKEI